MKLFISSAISFMLVINGILSADQTKMVKHPIELAILIDGSTSIKGKVFEQLFELVQKIPDTFVVSENEVRVAVIMFAETSRIVMNLTADERSLRQLKMPNREEMVGTSTELALMDAKEKVFKEARPNALKVVYLITDGHPATKDSISNFEPTERIAAELRQTGVIIFVGLVGDKYENAEIKKHVDEEVAGDPSQVFRADQIELIAMKLQEKLSNRTKSVESTSTSPVVTPTASSASTSEPTASTSKSTASTTKSTAAKSKSTSTAKASKSSASSSKHPTKTSMTSATKESGGSSTVASSSSTSNQGGPLAGRGNVNEHHGQSSEERGSFPVWAIVLTVVGAIVYVLLIVAAVVLAKRLKKKDEAKSAKKGVSFEGMNNASSNAEAVEESVGVSIRASPSTVSKQPMKASV